MKLEDFNQPPILRRLRLWKPGRIGGTVAIVSAQRAAWAFRQTPVPSHSPDGPRPSWGFEVETLCYPKEALLALEQTGATGFRVTELWSRPAEEDEGEGNYFELPVTALKRKMDALVRAAPTERAEASDPTDSLEIDGMSLPGAASFLGVSQYRFRKLVAEGLAPPSGYKEFSVPGRGRITGRIWTTEDLDRIRRQLKEGKP